MPAGKITFSNRTSRRGLISADDGATYEFTFDEIVTQPLPSFLQGERVQFTVDGSQARQITVLGPAAQVPSTQQPARSGTRTGPYRFLNPYNFVRFFDSVRPAEGVLGSVPPPPHDRYVGLSGTITCVLTATTPLFIADSHGAYEDRGEPGHMHYRFFQDAKGEPAIPGTSLRGVIRSVFEAVTNSCLANFHGEKRLSYRPPPGDALKLVPARVLRHTDGRYELEVLSGTTRFEPDRRPEGAQYAAWLRRYQPMWANNSAAKAPNTPYAQRRSFTDADLQGLGHGSPCQAIIQRVQHPLKRFEFWNVVAIAPLGQPIRRPDGAAGELLVEGYLCITNQNIENKHDERLFFRGPGAVRIMLDLDDEVRRRYQELIIDYQERHADDLEKAGAHPEQPRGKRAGFSRFVIERKEGALQGGELVYALIDRGGRGYKVRYVVPVSVPRVTYDTQIGGKLPPAARHLHRCTEAAELCPACRTFGWVWEGKTEELRDHNKRNAYAGRVTIEHATVAKDVKPFDATLAILSAPKPTTIRFYLAPERGKPQRGLEDKDYNYDTPDIRLRGRKFYRHHGSQLREREYRSAAKNPKSDQNRTVHGVRDAGSNFGFTVRFENLAPVELGALLWSLEIDGWHHRIGLGKPLGFGSVQIAVKGLTVLDPAARYADLANSGLRDALDLKGGWVRAFKAELQRVYGAPFEELPPIRDLRALLNEPPLPVHYPRSAREPLPDGKNFEWFVGNKRSGRDAGPRLVLARADADNEGLPILDKFGTELR